MRRRTLTYADAVRLIGDPESPVVAALGHLGGAAAGVVTAGSVGTVDFFALRDQLVRWGHTAVAEVRGKLTGLDRVARTDRLAAAHAVLVLTSFFEALDDIGLDLTAAELTEAEQVAVLTGGELASDRRRLIDTLVNAPVPIPTPVRPRELVLEDLTTYGCGRRSAWPGGTTPIRRDWRSASRTAPTSASTSRSPGPTTSRRSAASTGPFPTSWYRQTAQSVRCSGGRRSSRPRSTPRDRVRHDGRLAAHRVVPDPLGQRPRRARSRRYPAAADPQ